MEYVNFGNGGMKVSRLCFGGMTFFLRTDDEGAIRIVHEALDAGINFIDTANGYGAPRQRGKSEELIGRALEGRRDGVVVATKFWSRVNWRDPNGGGCSRFHLMQAVEDSLRRLRTDHIDLYQMHHPDKNTPIEETLSTLDMLVKQGKVRYIGASNHYAWQMAHILGVAALHNWEPIVSIQCRYSVLDRVVENETMHFARRFNIACIPWAPLAAGLLSGKYRRDEAVPEDARLSRLDDPFDNIYIRHERKRELIYDVLEEMERIAGKYDIGMNQLAIKWLLSRDWVTSPIIGGSRAEHYSAMYNIFDVKVEEEDIARIDEISERFKYAPFHNQGVVEGWAEQGNWW